VFDEPAAKSGVQKKVNENPRLKGKTRVQMALAPFKGTEIRSNLLGIKVVITQEHIEKMLGLDNQGENVFHYKNGKIYKDAIEEDLYEVKRDFGKVASLKVDVIVAFKVMLASIFTRNGGTDTISWPHRHFISFVLKKVKINLAACLFDHLCSSITEGHNKERATTHHPRLISELFRQTKLIEILKKGTPEKLGVYSTYKFDAHNLLHLKLIEGPVIYPTNPPLEKFERYFFINGYPAISEADNEDVIQNFLEIFEEDTGIEMDRSMVAALPDFDRLNPPRRKRKKTKNVESLLVEDEDEAIAESGSEKQGDGVTEGAEKEKRSKKRNERPPALSDFEDNATLSSRIKIKKQKVVASAPPPAAEKLVKKSSKASKGKTSKPIMTSVSKAQNQLPPLPEIDVTKHISMILPNAQPETVIVSSNSEDTLSDSTFHELMNAHPKSRAKLASENQEVISEDNSVINQLSFHISGD
jgi:hypothetical protein